MPHVVLNRDEAGYVWNAKSTTGTTIPNMRRPLKDGYCDDGQNCVEDIVLTFGPGGWRETDIACLRVSAGSLGARHLDAVRLPTERRRLNTAASPRRAVYDVGVVVAEALPGNHRHDPLALRDVPRGRDRDVVDAQQACDSMRQVFGGDL